jgi:hypothetical protein
MPSVPSNTVTDCYTATDSDSCDRCDATATAVTAKLRPTLESSFQVSVFSTPVFCDNGSFSMRYASHVEALADVSNSTCCSVLTHRPARYSLESKVAHRRYLGVGSFEGNSSGFGSSSNVSALLQPSSDTKFLTNKIAPFNVEPFGSFAHWASMHRCTDPQLLRSRDAFDLQIPPRKKK